VQGNLGPLFKDFISFIRVFINAFPKLRNLQLRKTAMVYIVLIIFIMCIYLGQE